MNKFNSDPSSLANLELFRNLLKSNGLECTNTTRRDDDGMRMYLAYMPGTTRCCYVIKKHIMSAHPDDIQGLVTEVKLKLLFD